MITKSSGKTTFVDYSFFLQPLNSGRKVKIFYYSFEIGQYKKIAKMISYALYKYENLSYSDMEILNRTKKDITPIMDKIKLYYHKYKKAVEDKVQFFYGTTNPTQIYKDLRRYAEANGTFTKTHIKDKEGNIVKTDETYTANNPEELVIVIVDHIGLLKLERGYSKKENMDKLSEYMVEFRNICNYTGVFLQQFNRGISNVERQKLKGDELLPTDSDFSDTSNTYQDADIVLTAFNPSKYGLTRCVGVGVNKYNRVLTVLKSRVGEDNLSVITDFNGKVNYIKEL